MKLSLKERWEKLSERDQKTVKTGGVFLCLFLIAQLVWWPLFNKMSYLQDQILQEQSLIEWMSPRVAQLLDLKKTKVTNKTDKSLATIEKSLQKSGLKTYVKDFSQNAQRHISVSFVDVPFESYMEWLDEAQSFGWKVQQMNATPAEKSGVVQVDLVLS